MIFALVFEFAANPALTVPEEASEIEEGHKAKLAVIRWW